MNPFTSSTNPITDWDSNFAQGDSTINDIREKQLELLRRAGELWETQLEQWEDLANAEDSLKREYGGRYLFELLQNADDAMTDKLREVGPNAFQQELNRVAIILTDSSILVANDGLPFTQENLQALCRLYNSTKSASKQIGHKGIGFKSVLEITDNPEVYSSNFAFGFDRHEFAAEVRRITKALHLDSESLQILRVPFVRRLARLPKKEQQQIQKLLNDEFVTVIRLPLKTTISIESVAQQIRTEIQPELLLFLESTKQLLITLPNGESVEYWYETQRKQDLFKQRPYQNVTLWSNKDGQTRLESHWLLLASEKMPITDPFLLEGLGRAWEEVKAVKCAVAFRLTPDGKALDTSQLEQNFSVYFPTEEKSGLRFLLNADLYIEAARKDIRLNALNKWLVESMSLYVATAGVDALRSQFPGDPAIVEVLSPLRKPGRDFSSFFFDKYLFTLSQTEFVPDEKGDYHIPGKIRLAPKGVDIAQFRRFFPPNQFDTGGSWTYASLDVEQIEQARHDPFLLLPEVGGKKIDIERLAAILRTGPQVPASEGCDFLRFLVNWWHELTEKEQQQLKAILAKCAIIPTQHGWQSPVTENIFQANLRDDAEIDVPVGFDFSLVPLQAYGDDRAYDGRTANFLTAMGVRRYQAAEILRRSIFPVMTRKDPFERLLAGNHEAVYAGYRILQAFRDRERSGAQFEDIRTQVLVPCYQVDEPERLLWKSAHQVYFSKYWTANDDLEVLYGTFDDSYFLGVVPQLFSADDSSARTLWLDFFTWLGVNRAPRLLVAENSDLWNIHHIRQHPLQSHSKWNEYVSRYKSDFDCPDTNHKQANPNRRFQKNYAIHHFEEITGTQDVTNSLYRLFRLLGAQWELYKPHLAIKLRCRYKQCYKAVPQIPSYFSYCLQHTPWLAAKRWGAWEPLPFIAADIWHLGDDVRPEVRGMLPSLPDEFRQDAYFDIRADLLRREVHFNDYLALLKRLPTICPVEAPDGVQIEAYKWQRGVRAVFNWLGQAMHNSLNRLGDAHWPVRPDDLKVLAYRGDEPAYVSVSHPLIVYPDDAFIAQEWQSDLWFLKIDDSWTRLRDWLRVPQISRQIAIEPRTSSNLQEETEKIRERFAATLPAFLAVVHQQQNSRYPHVLGRLQRLDIHVVEKLILSQKFLSQPDTYKEVEKEIYLQLRDEPNPGGGQARRAGDLYIAYDSRNNPDILGRPIANYIEIVGLRDTFVLLYDRPDHKTRIRYLENRGIAPSLLDEIKEALQIEWDEETLPPDMDGLGEAFERRIGAQKDGDSRPIIVFPPSGSAIHNQSEDKQADEDESAETMEKAIEKMMPPLPPLALESNISIAAYHPDGKQPPAIKSQPKTKPIVIGGPGGGGPHVSEKIKEVYGQRGEEWAFHAEKQRLRRLGFAEDMIEEKVRWVSQEDKYAVCDIVSIDGKPGEAYEIYIEVKATTGVDRAVNWSISEFDLANEAGDRYWLYWVGNVKSTHPTLTRYQNPVNLWREKRAQLDFRKLVITLPENAAEGDNDAPPTTTD